MVANYTAIEPGRSIHFCKVVTIWNVMRYPLLRALFIGEKCYVYFSHAKLQLDESLSLKL